MISRDAMTVGFPKTRYPDVRVNIPDGGKAFEIAGIAGLAMRDAGIPDGAIDDYYDEIANADNWDEILFVVNRWVTVL